MSLLKTREKREETRWGKAEYYIQCIDVSYTCSIYIIHFAIVLSCCNATILYHFLYYLKRHVVMQICACQRIVLYSG